MSVISFYYMIEVVLFDFVNCGIYVYVRLYVYIVFFKFERIKVFKCILYLF